MIYWKYKCTICGEKSRMKEQSDRHLLSAHSHDLIEENIHYQEMLRKGIKKAQKEDMKVLENLQR